MLSRLLRSHLAPYRKTLLLIVALQTVQTSAALTLPTINARVIDKGVLHGDVGYIYSWGAVMLLFAVVQNALRRRYPALFPAPRSGGGGSSGGRSSSGSSSPSSSSSSRSFSGGGGSFGGGGASARW